MSCSITMNGCSEPNDQTYDSLNNISNNLSGTRLSHGYSNQANAPCQCIPRDIDPCTNLTPIEKAQCYIKNGYQQWDDDCTSAMHTGDGALQTNDNTYISCDFTFPFINDIDFGNVPFRGQNHKSYSSSGYIKYDQVTDDIIHVSMNTRQGKDPISTQGIIHTLAVDPNFKPEPLTGKGTSVSIDTADVSNYKPEDLVASGMIDNNFIHIKNNQGVNLSFDFFTCNNGWLCIRDIDGSTDYTYHVLGLGPVYEDSMDFSGDWSKLNRRCNMAFGTQQGFGIHGSHYPIMYVIRREISSGNIQTFGVFFDHYRKLEYYFDYLQTNQVIRVRTREPEWRFFIITGNTFVDVRKNFMKIVGPPSMPVRKAIGMHIARFGYRNWDEINADIVSLQSNGFPNEGFILDLYWYGMIFPTQNKLSATSYSDNFCHVESRSAIGNQLGIFEWDEKNFPQHKETAQNLMDSNNYALTLIEEPFVTADAPDFSYMYNNDMVATDAGQPYKSWIAPEGVWQSWLGKHVAIPDFTNPETCKHWFKTRIVPQSTAGTFLWWNDLGEPEVSNENALFLGVGKVDEDGVLHNQMRQAPEVQNFTQFLFAKGICDEYNAKLNKRYNVLVRAGTCGIQRYGAFQWPGDTNSNTQYFRVSFKSCSTLSLCGVDFSVTDTGGFSGGMSSDSISVYTPWFLNSCASNFMVKPHKWIDKTDPTSFLTSSPSEIGNVKANLNAIVERYTLSPYYYSWIYSISKGAHQGEMFVSPLWTQFQDDPGLFYTSVVQPNATGALSSLVGPSILYILQRDLASVENYRPIVLPVTSNYKNWYDMRNKKWVSGNVTVTLNDVQLPLFIRDKSIIPTCGDTVNYQTRVDKLPSVYSVLLYTSDGSKTDDFELYEDDGLTMNDTSTKYLLQHDPIGQLLNITVTGRIPSKMPKFIAQIFTMNVQGGVILPLKIKDNTVNPPSPSPPPSPYPYPGSLCNSNTWLYVTISIIIALLIILGVYIYRRRLKI